MGIERVFSAGHPFHDYAEGAYYDKGTDLYLTLAEAHACGIP